MEIEEVFINLKVLQGLEKPKTNFSRTIYKH